MQITIKQVVDKNSQEPVEIHCINVDCLDTAKKWARDHLDMTKVWSLSDSEGMVLSKLDTLIVYKMSNTSKTIEGRQITTCERPSNWFLTPEEALADYERCRRVALSILQNLASPSAQFETMQSRRVSITVENYDFELVY